jgi:hypothetical protein
VFGSDAASRCEQSFWHSWIKLQQSDIDSAITSGNNALSNADGVVQKAKQKRATYDNEANDLNNKPRQSRARWAAR